MQSSSPYLHLCIKEKRDWFCRPVSDLAIAISHCQSLSEYHGNAETNLGDLAATTDRLGKRVGRLRLPFGTIHVSCLKCNTFEM